MDDEPLVVQPIGEYLRRKQYGVETFAAARGCLRVLAGRSPALLISDIRMPEMDGIQLVEQALAHDPDIAVLMLTGVDDARTAVASMKLGAIDYLLKPVDLPDLEESVERALRRRAETLYRRELEAWMRREILERGPAEGVVVGAEEPAAPAVRAVSALIDLMERKDPYIKGHSERVAEISVRVARLLGLGAESVEEVRIAALLHDIGLVGVHESVLQKKRGLTTQEFEELKHAVRLGAEILKPLPQLAGVREILLHHRERLNGSGYPDGLKGETIPLASRIIGLAEAYDALTAGRPYQPPLTPREALETLLGTVGIWYDAAVFEALQKVLTELRKERKGNRV
ncbi:MAG: response regulator [Gemmatimonadetes bacterium]|nr:response regulator [Gemmatimonadota bacterium]